MRMKVPTLQLFPPDVVVRLVNASRVDEARDCAESLERQQAIDDAIRYAKQRCPELFRKEV